METDPQIRFQHLHKELLEYQLRFVDITLKGAGLTLLVLGWMLTSGDAREFIANNVAGRTAAIAGLITMSLAYVLITIRMSGVSRRIAREIDSLEYLPRSYYDYRVLPPRVILAATAVVLAPVSVIVTFMLLLR